MEAVQVDVHVDVCVSRSDDLPGCFCSSWLGNCGLDKCPSVST